MTGTPVPSAAGEGGLDVGLHDWLRLSLTPGVGNVAARKLLATFGLPGQLWVQPLSALRQVVSAAQAQALLEPPADLEPQWTALQRWCAGDPLRRVLTLADADYPPDLLHIPDPPLLLYAQGPLHWLNARRRLAVVGSRNPTPQGARTARDFAQALAGQGVCIVSGLALGVDGAAHEGALAGGGGTVAVVGTGLDRVYPRQHRDLAHRIAAQGVMLSEYPLGTQALAANFPKRNRLIAGLTQGTLVVEAALASGSLITARCAADLGKEVLAIPGSIHSPMSRGCHALIRQGAKLVETVEDVMEELRMPSAAPAQIRQVDPFAEGLVTQPGETVPEGGGSASSADPLLDAMGHDPVGLDALQARTGWPTATLQARLLELELDGEVARLPGGLFQRVVCA